MELPVEVTVALALATRPIGTWRSSSTVALARKAATVAAGCDNAAENGEVPDTFDDAIASVLAAVAAAPLVESWPTAALIWRVEAGGQDVVRTWHWRIGAVLPGEDVDIPVLGVEQRGRPAAAPAAPPPRPWRPTGCCPLPSASMVWSCV